MALPSRLLYQLLGKELFHQARANSHRSISHPRFPPTLLLTHPSPPSQLTSSCVSGIPSMPEQSTSGSRGYRLEPWRCAVSSPDSQASHSKPPQEPKTLPSVEAESSKPGTSQRKPEQKPKTIPFVDANAVHKAENERRDAVRQEAAPGVAEAKRIIGEEAKKEQARSDRDEILEAALNHVVTLGWSDAALAAGARDIGLSPAAAGVFGRGGVELLEFFIDECNKKLAKTVEEEGSAFSELSTRDKLVQAIKLRLEMQAPYVTTWPQALALQALPQNMAAAVQKRARLVDVLWEVTGDTAVDASWYAKRGLVAAVYGATEVYMLTDFSPGFAETWKFLERRIEEAVELKKSADEFKHLAEAIGAGLGSTFGSTVDRLMQGGDSSKRRR
ncbi:hypothetical protein KFL_000930250 [Klebsormidium nitens]|uniref:Ubiquinone biosynthesis protein n=1 Tax=Klebsormidium nitens TaxID=105231 RepID=A0A1Y1HXH6_KLENI|nr:hypothetical protein KFL_000930250 [Klebsormidium nitens]|eukprot:GAQ81879.1 hypothetical protein KFL_000930250 [Klebsormidium nitens]